MVVLRKALGLLVLVVLLALIVVPTFAQGNPWVEGVLNPPWYRGNEPRGNDH
jgi:hypothetical protein